MDQQEIVKLAIAGIDAEMERLHTVKTQLLNGGVSSPVARPGRKPMSEVERKAHSRRMKKMWREKRAQAK